MELSSGIYVDGAGYMLTIVDTTKKSSCKQCDLLVGSGENSHCHEALKDNYDCFRHTGTQGTSFCYKKVLSH